MVVSSSLEVGPGLGVGAFSFSCGPINSVSKAVGITEEVGVSDCTIVVTIDFSDKRDLFVVQFKF